MGGVLDRHVVVDQHHRVLAVEHVAGDLETRAVTGIVLYDQQHAAPGVDAARCRNNLVGCRRGEDLTGAGSVEHARTDIPGMQRLMPRAATGQQRNAIALGGAAMHEQRIDVQREQILMRPDQPRDAVRHEIVD